MDSVINIHLQGAGRCCTVGNISITLQQRYQKVYRSASNGQQIILEDHTSSPYRFPPLQFPPNALTSPLYLFQALTTLNLEHRLRTFLHPHIWDMAFELSSGGLYGFHMLADVEIVEIDVVEGGGDDDQEIGRLMRKEWARIAVEKLSRKQSGDVKVGEMCAVCLEEFEQRKGKGVIRMPCDHIFHTSCISRWLEEKNSCPMCRRLIHFEQL